MSAGDGSSSASHGELLRDFAEAPPLEPPPALPTPGDRIGRFIVGERLGSGASGVVFAARDDVLERDVALKILALDRAASRTRILREARAAAKILHPGVALVHDVLEREEGLCLVLERVHGKTLREALGDDTFNEARAVRVVAQAARAVHAAHEVGVIHRDLKPENIMMDAEDRVKLLDFGLATPGGAAGRRPAGTAGYLAPEACRGEVGPTSDLYALAIVLVELVTGERSANPRGLSPELQRVALRALADEPTRRYPTGHAFAAALEVLGEGRRWTSRFERAGLLLFGLASLSWPGASVEERAPVALVATPLVVRRVACPPLRAEPDRWLGAATAGLVCRRARSMLGGGRATAVPPAELLALPSTPSESFPRDALQREDARPRAIARARELQREEPGLVWIDGSVERAGFGFIVTLTLEKQGEVIASHTAEGSLAQASFEASRALFDDAAALRLEPSEPDRGEPAHDAALRDALDFGRAAIDTGGASREARTKLLAFSENDVEAAAMVSHLTMNLGEPRGEIAAPAVDRSTNETFITSAPLHVVMGGSTPAKELAREANARREEAEGSAKLSLVRAEALLRLLAEERDLARSLALAATEADPWDAPWDVLAHASFGRPEWKTLSRAHTAWLPESADAWNVAAHVDATPVEKGALLERAFVLGEHFPLYAGNYATWLLSVERLDEARAIIARLRIGSQSQRAAAVRLSLELAWAEGRLFGGFDDAHRALLELPTIGSIESGDIAIVANLVELGVLLGRGAEIADDIVKTFVDVEPPRLDRGPFARQTIAHACAYANPTQAARCFERLHELEARGFFPMRDTGEPSRFIEGAEAFSKGRMEDAARAFRSIQTEPGLHAGLTARAFFATGDHARANALDPPRPGSRKGLSMSHVRAALRAAFARDCAALRDLAPLLRAALEGIDGDLPAVATISRAASRCNER